MTFRDELQAMGACREALEWVGTRTLEEAWTECPNGSWLLWYAGRAGVDRRTLVQAACACARTALQYVPKGEDRPLRAIEAAEAWCRGEATIEAVREAASAAWAAAWEAARVAARAASAAWSAEAEAWAAAAEAAAWAAAESAARAECARLVRSIVPCPGSVGGRDDVS